MPLHSEHQQHHLIQGPLTCRCRRSAHKPGREFRLRWAGEQETAAAASSFGSYRNRSETCRTSAEGPGTSSAAGYGLWSEGIPASPARETVEMVRLDFCDCWWGQLWGNRKVHNLWARRLDVLPHAHWFWHHLPVWTSRLKESGKGRFPNSCIRADKNHIRTENTTKDTKTINPLLTNVTLNGNSFYSASSFLGRTRKTLLPCFISHNI